MENYSIGGITATTIFDTRYKAKGNLKLSEADKLYPVKYRITFMSIQKYYSTGFNLTNEEWDSMPKTRDENLKKTRKHIQDGFNKLKEILEELNENDGFSFESLNIRLSKGMKNSVISAIYGRSEALKNNGQIGSSEWYFYAAKSIERFVDKDLKFSQITAEWLKKFEKFLLDEGKSYTTISMYMRPLQATMRQAREQGIISKPQYPFVKDKYQIPTGTGRKLALTLEQIGEVIKYPLVSDAEKRSRDLWLFSYLCNGINLNDMLRLKYSNISDGEVHFYRQKTLNKSRIKKEIAATLLPEMQKIIDTWGNSNKKQDSYIFPFLSAGLSPIDERRIVKNLTKLMNDKMSAIGEALGYGKISSYWARHSYATVLKRSGANIAFISESLGHADLKTTENYLAAFEKTERTKNANKLIPEL